MGLFSFFNRKQNNSNDAGAISQSRNQNSTEIPESIFIEKDKSQTNSNEAQSATASSENGIRSLFQFLEKNYVDKGHDDALINPDNSHLEQNIEALKNDLDRELRKQKIFYEDFINEISFHISSRSRSGMVDTVEELNSKLEIAQSHIKQIIEIENDAKENKGAGQGIIISYTRGFRNGLSSISHYSILKKNL